MLKCRSGGFVCGFVYGFVCGFECEFVFEFVCSEGVSVGGRVKFFC